MLFKKMPNVLMLNEEKVMVNILTKGEDRVQTNMWYLDNEASNHLTGDWTKFKELDEKLLEMWSLTMDQLYSSKAKDPSYSSARMVINVYWSMCTISQTWRVTLSVLVSGRKKEAEWS